MENPTKGVKDVRYNRRHRWYCSDNHKYRCHDNQYQLSRRRVEDIKKQPHTLAMSGCFLCNL